MKCSNLQPPFKAATGNLCTRIIFDLCVLLITTLLSSAVYSQDTQTLRIGQSATLSGPLSELGKGVTEGIQAHFQEVNRSGGIHGRRLILMQLDDRYDESQAERNVSLLLKDGALAFMMPIGTPPSLGVMRAAIKHNVASVGAFTGAESTRAHNRSTFHVRAGFRDEMNHIVRHLLTIGIEDIAVVHNANPGATSSLAHIESALNQANKKLLGTIPVNDDLSNIDSAVTQLRQIKPKAIIFSSNTAVATEVIKHYRPYAPSVLFYAYSFVDGKAIATKLGSLANGLVVSQVVPDPWNTTNRLAREYRTAMEVAGDSAISYQSFEGYIAARVLTIALRRAGTAPTRESIREALNQLGELNFGAYSLQFTSAKNLGSSYVELTLVSSRGKYLK